MLTLVEINLLLPVLGSVVIRNRCRSWIVRLLVSIGGPLPLVNSSSAVIARSWSLARADVPKGAWTSQGEPSLWPWIPRAPQEPLFIPSFAAWEALDVC